MGPTARQEGGSDLYVNKNNFFCAKVLGGSLPPPCRPTSWRQGACRPAGGGRLPPRTLAQKKLFLFTYRSLPPT